MSEREINRVGGGGGGGGGEMGLDWKRVREVGRGGG